MTGESRALHHVIIGGSAAGVSAAVAMRENGFDGVITIVDADPLLPYERPPLSKTPDPLAALRLIRPEDDYARHRIDLRLGTRVARLDVGRRQVVLADGEEIAADRVLLATGVAARRLDVPGGDLAEVLTLRDAADAERIFAGLARGGPLSIVGGGFIGLEAAAVARTKGIDVTVVENAELPLLKALGPEAACLMTRLHQERGVRIITDRTVREIRGTGAVEEVILCDGGRVHAAMVIVGCGVVPNDRLARQAGVPCERRNSRGRARPHGSPVDLGRRRRDCSDPPERGSA